MIASLFSVQNFLLNPYIGNYSLEGEEKFTEWRKSKNFTYLEIFEKMAPTCEDIFLGDVCTNADYRIEPMYTVEYGRCWKYYPPQMVATTGRIVPGKTKGVPLPFKVEKLKPFVFIS